MTIQATSEQTFLYTDNKLILMAKIRQQNSLSLQYVGSKGAIVKIHEQQTGNSYKLSCQLLHEVTNCDVHGQQFNNRN